MKMPKEEFLALQSQWYDVLARDGFKDIERLHGEEMILKKTAAHCFSGIDDFTKKMQEEYFRCLAQAALDEKTVYKNDIHRYILVRHSEGAKAKDIRLELIARGVSRSRHSIRFIVRKYEVAWGLRSYEARKLNKYG